MQIPELLTQRKFVSAECHAHFNAQTVAPVAPKIFVLDKKNFFGGALSLSFLLAYLYFPFVPFAEELVSDSRGTRQ